MPNKFYKISLILFLIFTILISSINASENILKLAVTPFENGSGYNKYDYLSDFIYNLMVTKLHNYDDILLFERHRADIINKERDFSMNDLFKMKQAPAVYIMIQGLFYIDKETKKFCIKITTTFIRHQNTFSESYIIEEDSFSIDSIILDINKFLDSFADKQKLSKPPTLQKKLPKIIYGSKVAVTGFNNYSLLTKYDSLQKGIIYLIEERLQQNKKLAILDRLHLKKIFYEQFLKNISNNKQIPENFAAADLLITGCFTFSENKIFIYCRLIDINTTEIIDVFYDSSDLNYIFQTIENIIEEINKSLSENQIENISSEKIYPTSNEALIYYSRGIELFDKNEYQTAVEYINRAIIIDPSYTYGKWQAGKIYEEYLMNYDKAVEAYLKVLSDTVNNQIYEKTLLRLGMINYKYLKNYNEAIKYFSEFKNKFNDSAFSDIIYYTLGHSLQIIGKYQEALQNYLYIIDSNVFSPLMGSFYIRSGQCCYFLKDFLNAKKYFQKAADNFSGEIFKSEAGMHNIYVGEEALKYLSEVK